MVEEELIVQILTAMDTMVSSLMTNMEESISHIKGIVTMIAMVDKEKEELIPLHLIMTRDSPQSGAGMYLV